MEALILLGGAAWLASKVFGGEKSSSTRSKSTSVPYEYNPPVRRGVHSKCGNMTIYNADGTCGHCGK